MQFPPCVWFVAPYKKPLAFQNLVPDSTHTLAQDTYMFFLEFLGDKQLSERTRGGSVHEAVQTMLSPRVCPWLDWSGDSRCQQNEDWGAGILPNISHTPSSDGDLVVGFIFPRMFFKTCNNLCGTPLLSPRTDPDLLCQGLPL